MAAPGTTRQLGNTSEAHDPRGQIKARDRVRELAEVYTHEREVMAMLDLVPDMFPPGVAGGDLKFLEPACGSGNFLEEVLRRKLRHIRFGDIRSIGTYEHRILRAVASIYGVDICAENVTDARDRMEAEALAHFYSDTNGIEPSDGFVAALRTILATNILQADFLVDAPTTVVVEYQPLEEGYFKRVWSMLDDSASVGPQPYLFHQGPEPKRDEVPVHYLDLASTPDPTRDETSARDVRRSA